MNEIVNTAVNPPRSLEYAFDTERDRQVEFSYPGANLEAVQSIIEKYGLDDYVAVREIADILEQRSLDGMRFNRLADRHAGVERYMFDERDAVTQYVHDTSRLIAEINDESYEAMIYLDKSARPPELLVGALWNQYANDGAKTPSSDFLNIDRVEILSRHGYPATKKMSNEAIQDYTFDLLASKKDPLRQDAARIRTLFVEGEVDPNNILSVFDQPSRLDGKSICIVDEVKSSGATLRIASALLEQAFPDSKIASTYFWSGPHKSVPIWYEEGFATGRGIGDPDPTYYRMMHERDRSSTSLNQVIGSFALSAPHYYLNDAGEIIYYQDRAWELLCDDIGTLARCKLFGYVSIDNWERGLQRNTTLFYNKLAELGYDGPLFDPSAIETGLLYGGRTHPAEGYLSTRLRRNR